ncbi:MAG: nucleotidyl transferase AbiEii/AbiGii toxin family protein [Burkholderiaceae bacterium]|nr:nucleotidyl transferase AbiEii/AbiGii toxin family protein [Burkholderiaceae bacterium]
MFVQDLPRLSVDLDVAVVDHASTRDEALRLISDEISRISAHCESRGLKTQTVRTKTGDELKIWISNEKTSVKVEVNYVFRGTVLPITVCELSKRTRELFSKNLGVPVLDRDELYGSKLVAVMDRQHPRDLFDVMHMLKSDGLNTRTLDCLCIYLAGHNRPIHEVLFHTQKIIDDIFNLEFLGMTSEQVHLDDLKEVQAFLSKMPQALHDNHKAFLLSVTRTEPDWEQLPYAHVASLPAIRWKLENLRKLRVRNPSKFHLQHDELLRRFGCNQPPQSQPS